MLMFLVACLIMPNQCPIIVPERPRHLPMAGPVLRCDRTLVGRVAGLYLSAHPARGGGGAAQVSSNHAAQVNERPGMIFGKRFEYIARDRFGKRCSNA